jgi:hypothetical protein
MRLACTGYYPAAEKDLRTQGAKTAWMHKAD